MGYTVRVPGGKEGLSFDDPADAIETAKNMARSLAPAQRIKDPKSPGVPWAVTVDCPYSILAQGEVVAEDSPTTPAPTAFDRED